mmetsp:Transcript_3493/g.5449  ORF Transcript_3493/g.5449 Transcript_3493/m.5449 type:complete len:114 (-) Transcript_3493:175-516(-)
MSTSASTPVATETYMCGFNALTVQSDIPAKIGGTIKKHMDTNHLGPPTSANNGVFDTSLPKKDTNRHTISYPAEDNGDGGIISAALPNEVNYSHPPSYPADDDGDGSVIATAA